MRQTQSSRQSQCSGKWGCRLRGATVTYHPGDVASLLQHLSQGGLVEWKAPHRGDCKVVCDTIAKAEPASEQGGSRG